MKISVIGTGYVGLVTGTCFAESGNDVICIDNDARKVATLKKGISTIFESGLQELLTRNIREKRLSFSTKLSDAVRGSSVIFLALPTPPQEDGSADLQHILSVSKEIALLIKEPKLIVLKSTVPVGTNEKVREIFAAHTRISVSIVSNPEFQKQGTAVQDFMSPDRVVVGTSDQAAGQVMRELYSPFMRTSDRFILMDERSAELTKYAANSFLAMKISFMNEIANLCDATGADVEMIRKGISADQRIGRQFLFPGVGYGGSCFPKDVKALKKIGDNVNLHLRIVSATDEVNEAQKRVLIEKMSRHFEGDFKGKTFAVWGLSFKPKTDDLREAPSVVIIRALLEKGADVNAYDPVAMEKAKVEFLGKEKSRSADRKLGDVRFMKDQNEALKNVDALVLVTEWQEFREPDYPKMKAFMRHPVIFDGRNIYNPEKARSLGFEYYGIGRK
jgi:UDPglucose 6-dehydrogenase